MIFGILTLATVLGAVQGGQLSVLFTPPSVRFQPTNDVLPERHVTSVLQSIFGLQTKIDTDWRGVLASNFFDRPRALVLLSISGLRADQLNITSRLSYDTLEDDPEPLNLQQMFHGMQDLSTDGRPVLFIELMVDKYHRVHLESGNALPRVADLQLSANNRKIYVELHAIKQTVSTISANFDRLQRDTPDLFHFHVRGLENIADRYGYQSAQMTQAVTSLQNALEQTSSVLRKLYSDDVIILALSQSSSRQTGYPSTVSRRLLQHTTDSTSTDLLGTLNLAPEFTWMYPVMFNITLWFVVTFSLIVFGVSWCMWFTDPGRDGIIYRMTTTHIKQA